MKNLFIASFLAVGMAAAEPNASAGDAAPKVELKTNKGTIVVELDPQAAPKTVENFLAYVNAGQYDGTLFHRVIKEFMIQGGGFNASMVQKPVKAPIQNEADNGLKNDKGTIAMARTMDPHSATAQFFINTDDNDSLDHQAKNTRGWGYCVFGKVVEGMDVVETIENQKTTSKMGHQDVPVESIAIEKATVLTGSK